MDFLSLFFIAVGLAMDAFSVAITDGIVLKKVRWTNAAKIGLFFWRIPVFDALHRLGAGEYLCTVYGSL